MIPETSKLRSSRWATHLLLATVSTALAFAVVEGVIRSLDLFRAQRVAVGEAAEQAARALEEDTDESTSSSRWIVHPFRGISPRPGGEQEDQPRRFNVLGIDSRVDDPRSLPEEDLVIGIFGGSVARETAISGGRFFQRAVEERLNDERSVRVVNFAISGYKQPQQVNLLSELLLLDVPIDVVVNLDGFNELVLARSNAEVPYHPMYPHYHFWVSGLASNTGALSRRQVQLQARISSGLERAYRIGTETEASWVGRSAIVQAFAGERVLRARADARVAEQELRLLPVRKLEDDLWHLDDPCLEASGHCRDLIVDLWRDASIMMQGIAESHGMPYFHVLQPNQYVAGSKAQLHAEERDRAWAPDHPWSRWAAEGYSALVEEGEVLSGLGVRFLDTTQIFRNSGDADYSDTCCHLTFGGRRKLAEEMGHWIGESLAADRRTR
ncbi:MAG: hypothetical protein MPN21_18540 [Thermoanaerobaculia bacterium]|nr:hypothetical protein [Thermoanaerobaculia bacterium]